MHFFNRRITVLSLCLIGLSGCGDGSGPDATVQGTVTLDGVLAKSGNVVFHPANEVPAAYGTIGKDGTFVLRVGRGNIRDVDHSKIYPGEYVATVTIHGPSTPDTEFEGVPPLSGPRLVAAKYCKKATSGLAFSIKSGRNVVNIEVESPSEEELQAISEAAEIETEEAEAVEAEATVTDADASETRQQPADDEETTTEEGSDS